LHACEPLLDRLPDAHRLYREHVQGGLIPDHGGVLQPLDQVPSDLEGGERHQGQPQAGDRVDQGRAGDEVMRRRIDPHGGKEN
jgi:hypothetical protein